MSDYSEQDLKYAAELRDEVHKEALAIARQTYPAIDAVIDRHPVEDYFQQYWDYPGKWYTMVAIPDGYKSRAALVEEIVRITIENYRRTGGHTFSAGSFYDLIAHYPDCVVDYYIAKLDAPYNGCESHWNALMKAALYITSDGWEVTFKPSTITAKSIPTEELFAPADKNGALNYRKAFLYPPHTNNYTDADFDKINAALFPNGTDSLEVYKWSTDWSNYFDDGHEWWGALCITVYDRSTGRFAVIMASATD